MKSKFILILVIGLSVALFGCEDNSKHVPFTISNTVHQDLNNEHIENWHNYEAEWGLSYFINDNWSESFFYEKDLFEDDLSLDFSEEYSAEDRTFSEKDSCFITYFENDLFDIIVGSSYFSESLEEAVLSSIEAVKELTGSEDNITIVE